MIIEHKTIEILGKKVFEKVVVSKTFKNPNPLPNEGCFFYVLEGTNQSISETQNISLRVNEGVLMKCGNYMYRATPNKTSHRLAFIAIHIYPSIMEKIYSDDAASILNDDSSPYHHPNMAALRANPFVSNYMESLLLYFEHPKMANASLMILKFKEFISLMLSTRENPDIKKIISNLFKPKVVAFKEIIKAHIFTELTIEELAMLTNSSIASFKRKFRDYYNDSPASYRMKKRFEKSIEDLCYSDKSISEIAFQCSFKNTAHFASAFKKRYGMSPSEYRKSYTEK